MFRDPAWQFSVAFVSGYALRDWETGTAGGLVATYLVGAVLVSIPCWYALQPLFRLLDRIGGQP